MASSDGLFDLIHSLKKEEKRHFKLYVKKYQKNSKYIRLFEVLASMKTYSERELREQCEQTLQGHRLSVAKEYLYTLILKSLRDIEPNSPEEQLSVQTQDIRQLLNRRLYTAAAKRIKKAHTLAAQHDLMGETIILHELEAYLPTADRTALFNEWEKQLNTQQEIYTLGRLAESLRQFRETKGSVRTQEDREELESLTTKLALINVNNLSTFSAKLRYHFGWARYYEITDQLEKKIESEKAIVALYELYPQHIETQQLAYIGNVLNICAGELTMDHLDTVQHYLSKVQDLKTHKQLLPFGELLLFRFEQVRALHTKDWRRIITLYEEFPLLLLRNASETPAFGKDIRIDFHLNFVRAFFQQQKFDVALREAEALLKLPSLSHYPYQENNIRILLLIIHYELNNAAYLPYLVRSTYRTLSRRERLFQFENVILHYLGSLARVRKKQDMFASFKKLHDEIQALAESTDREFPWSEFYMEWLRNKTTALNN